MVWAPTAFNDTWLSFGVGLGRVDHPTEQEAVDQMLPHIETGTIDQMLPCIEFQNNEESTSCCLVLQQSNEQVWAVCSAPCSARSCRPEARWYQHRTMTKYEMRRQSPVKQQAVDQVVPRMEVDIEPREI